MLIELTRRGRRSSRRDDRRRQAIAEIARAIPTGQLGHLIEALTAFGTAAGEPPATGDAVGLL